MCRAAAFYRGQAAARAILGLGRWLPNSLVVASSISTGLMQGVVLFLATQGARFEWLFTVVA
jgi:hypothetical protein